MSKLSDTINDGLFQRLNSLCGTTTNTYPFKTKTADINDSLDWYCNLAFKADNNWNFDDIGETSPPIDTQNLVSGTNRYKISAFTEKIIKLIKLEVLDDNADGHFLIPETIEELEDSFESLYLNPNDTGTPTHYVKYGDFIYLRPTPNYSETSGLKAYFNRPANKFEFVTFTVTQASPAVFTAVGHGLVAGDTVILETDGALLTGLSVDTQYWVISTGLTNDAFELSTSKGGAAINTTSTQSGTHCFLKTNAEPGIVLVHQPMLVRKAASNYMEFNNTNGVYNAKLSLIMPQLVKDEEEIGDYYSSRDKDVRRRVSPTREDNR